MVNDPVLRTHKVITFFFGVSDCSNIGFAKATFQSKSNFW